MARPRKNEEDKYVKSTLTFEPEQYHRIVSFCEREGHTLSWVVRKALEDWMAKHNV